MSEGRLLATAGSLESLAVGCIQLVGVGGSLGTLVVVGPEVQR